MYSQWHVSSISFTHPFPPIHPPSPFLSHPYPPSVPIVPRPSYNVPFYKDIFTLSGYPATIKQFGLGQSYQLAPRAKIFRRDADGVHSMEDMKVQGPVGGTLYNVVRAMCARYTHEYTHTHTHTNTHIYVPLSTHAQT